MEKQIINEKKVFLRLINIKVFNCKYEEKNREKRKSKSGNFQTLISRDILDEITFPNKNGIPKAVLSKKV